MTKNEARKIIAVLIVSYPNFKPVDVELMTNTWAEMLEDFTYEQANLGLKAYIRSDTSGFAPSIGQLIEQINKFTHPEELNEMEAWALVSNALRNGYYHAEDEFGKLPSLVQKAVGNPSNIRNWAQTNNLSVENVIQSNFIKTYRLLVMREGENRKLPKNMQEMIEDVNKCVVVGHKVSLQIEEKGSNVATPMPDSFEEKLKEKWNR